MESEENKREIILSSETKNLTNFSSTRLITRGQKLADLLLLKNPLMNKVEEILLKEFSKINNNKSEHALYYKIKLAIALLEIGNKTTENWAINILNEEQEKPEEEGYQDSILRQKNQLLQVISKLGKHKIVSEYILEKIKISWDGTNFLDLFGWNFIFFSDNQIGELIELFSIADEISKIKIIETLRKSGRKQEEIISYLQGIAQNDAKVWLKIMACDALINLGQAIVAKNALIPILRDKSSFNEDARILLALIENNKEESAQAIKILREKIQKETSISWLQRYISYLSKLGEKELAVSLLLDVLTSPGADEKENRWKFKSAIDSLIELDCKNEIFLDRLIDLSTDVKTDSWLRLQSFYAMLEFENINELQVKELLALLESNAIWVSNICAAGVLANFQKTEDLGVDLLIRSIKDKSLALGLTATSKIITQNKRLAFNSKFLKMLYDLPDHKWGTNGCLTVIKILKKAEQ